MKKTISVLSLILSIALIFGSLPIAFADNMLLPNETLMDNPRYANSFLLSVESESKREYTHADFPNVEGLYRVRTVKLTATETEYQYLLLMAIDNYNVSRAKQQASAYGAVLENYLASDYASATSYMELNHTSLEIKVGETIELEPVILSLTPSKYALSGIMFTVDPTVIDEVALVENEYQNMGFYTIYGIEDISMLSWQKNTAVMWDGTSSAEKTISPIHTYCGMWNYKSNLFDAVHDLANQEGVVSVQLVYEPAVYAAVMPYVHYHCDPEGIVMIEEDSSTFKGTITALHPGEVIITAEAGGGGYGSTTTTCKITVTDDTPDVTITDIGNKVIRILADESVIYKYSAVSALHILKACVGKEAGSINPVYDVNADGEISAQDALWALQSVVGKRVVEYPLDYCFPE